MTDPNAHHHHHDGVGTTEPGHGDDSHGEHEGHGMDHGQHDDHAAHSGHAGHGDRVGQFRRLFWINLVIAVRVAVLLRRGDFPLTSIAAAVDEIHQRGDTSTALARLHEWRQSLDTRSRQLLAASVHLDRCIPPDGDPRRQRA